MAVTTLLLLLLFATARAMAMNEDEANFVSPDDTMPEDEDQKMASMSHARGGLNDASRELPSLNTAGTDNAMSADREASLGAIPAVEPHPEFQEFIHKHKKSGHNYCPDLPLGTPCVEMLRRCARFSTTPPTPFVFCDSGRTRPLRPTFRSPPSIRSSRRRELSYLENKAIIDAHNARSDTTFKMGQTPYSDFSSEEFRGKVLKYAPKNSLSEKRAEKKARAGGARSRGGRGSKHSRRHPRLRGSAFAATRAVSSYPKNFNWADVPEVMGKIHTQETSCASCWAYSSTDTIEAQLIISRRRKKHVELSAEQLINCDRYDSGCNTGNMFTAYEWIHENGGLATARAFHGAAATLASARSYMGAEMPASAVARADLGKDHHTGAAMVGEASPGSVRLGGGSSASSFRGTGRRGREAGAGLHRVQPGLLQRQLPRGTATAGSRVRVLRAGFRGWEEALMEAVSKQPVAIGINANKVFQLYASGIITAKDCGPAPHTRDSDIMAINHAVVVTGWGEEWVKGRLIKYWILKNSFGEGWGENGYFKLERPAHAGCRGFRNLWDVLRERVSGDGREARARRLACPGPPTAPSITRRPGAATLGNVAPKKETPIVGGMGRPKMAAVLVGVGFIAGLLVSTIFVVMGRFTSWTRRASEETSPLLPN